MTNPFKPVAVVEIKGIYSLQQFIEILQSNQVEQIGMFTCMWSQTNCKDTFREWRKFRNHMLRHAKMMECELFLGNDCKSKFINFNMYRTHLETVHEMDLLGQEMLLKKFNSKQQGRNKIFNELKMATIILIMQQWLKELMNDNNYSSEMQAINIKIKTRQKNFKPILTSYLSKVQQKKEEKTDDTIS